MSIPALTLYRDGLVNLNGDATRVLKNGQRELMLLPPATTRPRWMLLPSIPGLGLEINLIGWAARDRHLRFRAPALAVAVFAALPPEATSIRLALDPLPHGWNLIAQ